MDSVKAARLYRKIRSASNKKEAYDAHVGHSTSLFDAFDPSLSNQLVYNNRQDWQACAATHGFIDVDVMAEIGFRRYLTPSELAAIVSENNTKSAMNLY